MIDSALRSRAEGAEGDWDFTCKGGCFALHVSVPQLSVQQAGLQTVAVGQLAIGPITVGSLVLNNADFSMSAAQGVLSNVSVTVTIKISVTWHVHVGLPDGIPDINVGDTYDLGSVSFSMNIGNIVTVPGLNNIPRSTFRR